MNFRVSGIENGVMEQEFVSNDRYMAINYMEESTEFVKDCSETSFFECWAEQIAETRELQCRPGIGIYVTKVIRGLPTF